MKIAKRLNKIPPYLFAELDRMKAEASGRGVDVINLGIGDPDLPTCSPIVEKMCEAVRDPANHNYPPYAGTQAFRESVARYYKRRFGVSLDPDKEVLALIGSKEGIAHVFLACVDPGDQVLIPDPGYPVYQVGALMAGGEPSPFPLLEEKGFLPDLLSISPDLARKARLMFLNYPNNPTGASAELSFFEEVSEFARKYDIIVCHDNAYSEVAYDGFLPPSFLQAEGAKEMGIEFGSLSKPYNMTGWRIGYAVGNSALIKALGTVKNNIDSGAFKAVQEAGILALDTCDEEIRRLNKIYQRRRDVVAQTLQDLGLYCLTPRASFYLWARVPSGYTSTSFTAFLLSTCGVIVAPGVGYGSRGEGYFRISITLSEERIGEALERMRKALKGNPCETAKSKA